MNKVNFEFICVCLEVDYRCATTSRPEAPFPAGRRVSYLNILIQLCWNIWKGFSEFRLIEVLSLPLVIPVFLEIISNLK